MRKVNERREKRRISAVLRRDGDRARCEERCTGTRIVLDNVKMWNPESK